MTTDQILLFSLFGAVLAMLLWGRVRHDLVAAGGLLIGVAIGVVPEEAAFSGFASPAVVIVALVLVASRAFENSGALGVIAPVAAAEGRSIWTHIAIIGGIGAALSAVINNVAALAMLMPLDVQAARRAGRPPGLTLMPLAFATILGGMVTLIGTPPNIIASSLRERHLGEAYGMFDFTPVGAAVALAGIAFVALAGWRLVPRREDRTARIDPASFRAELVVPEGSKLIERVFAELDEEAEAADVILVGLVRDGRAKRKRLRRTAIQCGDVLVVEGSADAIAAFVKATDLEIAGNEPENVEDKVADAREAAGAKDAAGEAEEDAGHEGPEIVEAVVLGTSPLVGRSAAGYGLRRRHSMTLLGISRSGTVSRTGVGERPIAAGDELLLTGRGAGSAATRDRLGLVAVNRFGIAPFDPRKAALAVGIFALAIGAASSGMLSFAVAIAMAVAAYAALALVPAREFYTIIEWPIIVMLACLLPLGIAFEEVGGTALIAGAIVDLTEGAPPVVALVAIMVVTLTLSDVLNNVATIVITGPIAIDVAERFGVNPDTFLMGAAIAASCAFLTPIGHKNNTLIMGPGAFRFSDYWRMGLPLELVVLAVSVPMLLLVWPL